jgi:hypothetical protein
MQLDLRSRSQASAPKLPTMSPAAYEAARATWHARMTNEYNSSLVFMGLARQMERAGFDSAQCDACRGFAHEERRHGVLCGAVVEALGGEARSELPAQPGFPEHEGIDPVEAVLRNLLSVCCMSETVAVALIGAERLQIPAGPLHELLTEIYADEVGHARFGWRIVGELVPKLGADARRRLSQYLVAALRHLEEHELAHLPARNIVPEGGAALGLCSGSDARVLLYDTIVEVIIPGLQAVGLDARRAWLSRHG